uniref:Uncharacterized protein n=1 Tax=Glossina pallidipes TaxID=7398 RepID=A0A1B0A3H5_GLOPL
MSICFSLFSTKHSLQILQLRTNDLNTLLIQLRFHDHQCYGFVTLDDTTCDELPTERPGGLPGFKVGLGDRVSPVRVGEDSANGVGDGVVGIGLITPKGGIDAPLLAGGVTFDA